MTERRRILVIQTAFLGDLVLTTALFRVLREEYADAYIAILAIPSTAEILTGLPELDEILVHDKKAGGVKELFRIARLIRRKKFDTIISPHRSTRSSLLSLISGAKTRVGYIENELSFCYNVKIRRPMEQHESARILGLAVPLGISGIDADDRKTLKPNLNVGNLERRWVKELTGGRDFVLIAPGSAWATKRWLPDYFAEVAIELSSRGYRVILIGGPGDKEAASKIIDIVGDDVADLVGKTTQLQLAALIESASILICNDSAPIHIAAAFDTPTIALFGPTTPDMGFAPLSERAMALGVPDLQCRPCSDHGEMRCPKEHFACMAQLTPDMVIRAAEVITGKA